MSLNRLKRLMKLKHLSEFTLESIITDFGMYESAIINLKNIEITETEVKIGDDLKTLQLFLSSKNPIIPTFAG